MIYLVGFMGAGKTTIGRQVALKLGMTFVDSDHAIEQEQKRTIADIFLADGELHFRKLEKEWIARVDGPFIVSTGGGIVVQPENVQAMKAKGKIIYLHVPFDEVWQRIAADETRPIVLQGRAAVFERYKERLPIYEASADLIIRSRHVEETVQQIIEFIGVAGQAIAHEQNINTPNEATV